MTRVHQRKMGIQPGLPEGPGFNQADPPKDPLVNLLM